MTQAPENVRYFQHCAVSGLRGGDHFVAIEQPRMRPSPQAFGKNASQAPLLGLQAIGMSGVSREQAEIPGRNRPGDAVAILPGPRDQALADQLVRHAGETVELVKRRRMKGGGAQVDGQVRLGFEHHHRYALARERRGGDHAARPRARD
jgi:hypothetical protein